MLTAAAKRTSCDASFLSAGPRLTAGDDACAARPARCASVTFAGRIGEEAEEFGIRPDHQPRIAGAQTRFIGLHRAIEGEEIRIPVIGVGKDAVAIGVALAADLLGGR